MLGSGKASLAIALALERSSASVSRRHRRRPPPQRPAIPRRVEIVEAAHPLPDERSVAAALELLEQAGEPRRARHLLIACFTGGSSALTSLPPAGVTAAEKRDLHRLLLASGCRSSDVNTVRKQVSGFKGGRLAAAAAPARLINLTVSDVAGDALDAITDPSVANDDARQTRPRPPRATTSGATSRRASAPTS